MRCEAAHHPGLFWRGRQSHAGRVRPERKPRSRLIRGERHGGHCDVWGSIGEQVHEDSFLIDARVDAAVPFFAHASHMGSPAPPKRA